jgi:hypothetical protein
LSFDDLRRDRMKRKGKGTLVSSIASFYLMDRSDLAGLVRAAASKPETPMTSPAYDYLLEHGRDQDCPEDLFPWSGYVMAYLLTFLQEAGVDLGAAEYRDEASAINQTYSLTYLLTSADKRHLPGLESANVDHDAVARFFDEMHYGFDELGYAVEDGLGVLRQLVTALTDDEVLIVHIG